MSDSVFIDTNILVYAHDLGSGTEVQRRVAVNRGSVVCGRAGVVSTQVLQEFYVNITRKIPRPIPKAEAAVYVQRYFAWPVIRIWPATIRRAFEIEARNKLSFWDALIVSAAAQAGVKRIFSEDLNPGQKVAGVAVVNPFVGEL